MNCSHHFILPPPNGTTSVGVCKLCGETRVMANYIEEKYQGWRGRPKDAKNRKV